MNWAYLPIMFGLAFFYTKISFYESSEKVYQEKFINSSARSPSSVIGKVQIVTPVKNIPTSDLYRGLNDESFTVPFKAVLAFRGTVVGNPYVENFGFVVDDKSHSLFSIINFPDVSVGAYMHDVFSHLISAKSYDKKISWIHYFDAYKAGLQGEPHIYSYYVQKGLEDAIWETQKAYEESIDRDAPFEFMASKNTNHLEKSQKNIIALGLKKNFSKIRIWDLRKQNAKTRTFQVLARVRPQDKIQWMELYESSFSDYDQAFNKEAKSISFEKRFELLRNDIFDGRLDKSLHSVLIDEKFFTLKFSDHFSSRLLMGKIPADDYMDIVFDEAYALGRIHKRSLGEKSDKYIKAWAALSGAVIDEKIVELKYRLKDLQD